MTSRFDKARLPSRHVTEGPERAPHRSYFYAMGLTEEEIHQPWVGVATCWNEAAPCNITLNRQAQSVKRGVKTAGGTPREFTTITVTDGIAMGHEGMRSSLASRDAIADTVELTMRGHCYDALVGLAGSFDAEPATLSGGMRKRAAIARALALDPPLLFLDEPSAGLDPLTSAHLDELILHLRDDLGTTVVMVSHELDSIFALADRLLFLDAKTKTMTALGPPRELRQHGPEEVQRFLRRGAPAPQEEHA